jgi:hypothetical protein
MADTDARVDGMEIHDLIVKVADAARGGQPGSDVGAPIRRSEGGINEAMASLAAAALGGHLPRLLSSMTLVILRS